MSSNIRFFKVYNSLLYMLKNIEQKINFSSKTNWLLVETLKKDAAGKASTHKKEEKIIVLIKLPEKPNECNCLG